MRVLHLSSALSWGGGEQQIIYLIEELSKKNIHQQIACPSNSVLCQRLDKLPVKSIPYRKLSGLNWWLALQLKKFCRREKIDLIHAHDSNAHTAVYIAALTGLNTPAVVSRRVAFQPGKGWFSARKYRHPIIKQFICVSKAIQIVMQNSISDNSRVSVVHSGIDLSRFANVSRSDSLHHLLQLKNSSTIVGNVATLSKNKDLITFINTAELVLKVLPEVQFVIIGDGDQREILLDYIRSKNLEKSIHLTGFRKDVPELISNFDIFLMTSISEGLGTSILDAFASKVPVVATETGGIPEIVHHLKTGLLAPVSDAHALSEHVVTLLTDQKLRTSLIENASRLLQEFSITAMADKTYGVYLSVLKK